MRKMTIVAIAMIHCQQLDVENDFSLATCYSFVSIMKYVHTIIAILLMMMMNSLIGIIGRVAQYVLGIDQTQAEIDNARRRFAQENLVPRPRRVSFSICLDCYYFRNLKSQMPLMSLEFCSFNKLQLQNAEESSTKFLLI